MRVGGVVCVQHWPSTCEVLKVLFCNKKKSGGGEGKKENASPYQKHFLAFIVALSIATKP